MDMPDNQLTEIIMMALECQTVITPPQQATAWDRLLRHASVSVQRMDPAPRRLTWAMLGSRLRGLRDVLLAEDIYQRAAQDRYFCVRGLPLTGSLMMHYYPLFHTILGTT